MPADVGRRPLDVLIVCYNETELLARCLTSVRTHLPGEQIRIWNNRSSATPDIRRLSQANPDVDWVFSADGIGFAAGFNGLMARSTSDVLMLNPDAELLNPLDRVRAAVEEDRVAAASPLVDDPGGRDEPWDVAHRRRGVVRILVNHAGYAGTLRRTLLSDLYPTPPHEVDGYIAGACMVVSRAAWDDVGPFDERYFLYGEDHDWQRRARERGWRLRLVHELGVRHGEPGAADGPPAPRSADLLVANTALSASRGANRGRAPLITGGQLVLGRVQRSKRRARDGFARAVTARAERSPAVVLTTDTLAPGPARRQKVLLANELTRRGFPVTIVCLEGFGVLERQLDYGVRLALRTWWQPIVDVPGDDVVLLSGATPAELTFAAAWSRLGGRGRGRRRWVRWEEDGGAATVAAGTALLADRCDATVTAAPDRASEWAPARPRFVLPPAVDPQVVREGRAVGPLSIGVVAGAGDRTVLDAIERVSGELEVVVLDGGSPADRTDRRCWDARPGDTFARLDAVCLPDPSWPAGLVAVEAMACGTTVIAPGTRQFVDLLDDGDAGLLVRNPTVDGWSDVLAALDPTMPAEQGRRGRRKAETRYTVTAAGDAFEALVAGLLDSRTAAAHQPRPT